MIHIKRLSNHLTNSGQLEMSRPDYSLLTSDSQKELALIKSDEFFQSAEGVSVASSSLNKKSTGGSITQKLGTLWGNQETSLRTTIFVSFIDLERTTSLV